jgi:predicted Zn-dependent protease
MKKSLSFLLASIPIIIISCAHTGSIAQFGAAVGQATGVISESTASAIVKSGQAFEKAFEEITPEQEYYIGRAVGANILANYKLENSKPNLVTYVNRICSALVIHSPRPEIFNGYHVNILDSNEINAFSTPGGHIFITRGLAGCATSEDTLAAVIAHEIAHIQLQHGLKSIKNSRITQALLVTGSSAASAASSKYDLPELKGIFSESVNEIVTTMVNNGYSQPQEFEADSMAMELLALIGYEPGSLLEMLAVLEKNQPGRPGGFNKTHPSPAQRITNAKKASGKYQVPDTRSFRKARYDSVK